MSASGGGVWLLPPQLLLSLLYICSHLRLLCAGLFLAGRSTESPGFRFRVGGGGLQAAPGRPASPSSGLVSISDHSSMRFSLFQLGLGSVRLTSTFDRIPPTAVERGSRRLAGEEPVGAASETKLVPQRSPHSYKEGN